MIVRDDNSWVPEDTHTHSQSEYPLFIQHTHTQSEWVSSVHPAHTHTHTEREREREAVQQRLFAGKMKTQMCAIPTKEQSWAFWCFPEKMPPNLTVISIHLKCTSSFKWIKIISCHYTNELVLTLDISVTHEHSYSTSMRPHLHNVTETSTYDPALRRILR